MNVSGRFLPWSLKALLLLSLTSLPALAQSVKGACLYALDPTAPQGVLHFRQCGDHD
jgi:hypothetical protein